jgi:hypothetical protein
MGAGAMRAAIKAVNGEKNWSIYSINSYKTLYISRSFSCW